MLCKKNAYSDRSASKQRKSGTRIATIRINGGLANGSDTVEIQVTKLSGTVAFTKNPHEKERLVNVHIEKLEAQLNARQKKIEELEAGIDRPCTSDYRRCIANLKTKHAAARRKLDELKAAGNEKWELHKAGIWITWNELENAFATFNDQCR